MIVSNELKKIFGIEYYNAIANYIAMIQSIIDNYDIAIIMARKAYCFYSAVLELGLIHSNKNCLVISSRAVTFGALSFEGQKVAIIEDVVVQGISLSKVLSIDEVSKSVPHILVAACSKEYYESFKATNNNEFSCSCSYLDDKSLLELATLISNFIISAMVPYNVDFPCYELTYSNYNTLIRELNTYDYFSISKLMNNNDMGIEEGIIHFFRVSFLEFNTTHIINDAVLKIRVYISKEKSKCLLMPIVLLPVVKFTDLQSVYDSQSYKPLKILFEKLDNKIQLINFYKILQYDLSLSLGNSFIKELNKNLFQIKQIDSYRTIFPFDLSFNQKCKIENSICSNYNDTNIIDLYYSLASSYNLIIENCNLKAGYNKEFHKEFITYQDLVCKISSDSKNENQNREIASIMLDVFIDNGIVVPRIVSDCNSIQRIYKFGEVAKLTIQDFGLFSNVLYKYADYEGRLLGKTEVEKVAVLFFKTHGNCFNVEGNESESYRVCFSKFGPRISSSEKVYRVNQNDALIEKLKEHRMLEEIDGKINIPNIMFQNESISNADCEMFTNGLHKIHKYYENAKKEKQKSYVFTYVNSFVQLLTLYSIGNKEEDKITSLVAEVDLVKMKNYDQFRDDKSYISSLQSIIDGVINGIWKYYCYLRPDLLKDLTKYLVTCNYESNISFLIKCVLNLDFRNNQIYNKEYLYRTGDFLIDIAIFNYYCCKYYGISTIETYGKNLYNKLLLFEDKSIHYFNLYKDKFGSDNSTIEEFIKEKNKSNSILANRLIDEYVLYESNGDFTYAEFSMCFGVYCLNKSLKIKSNNRYKHYSINDILLYPCDDNSMELLTFLMQSYNSVDYRIVFYSPDDGIKLLATELSIYGELFIKKLKRILGDVKKLKPSLKPEIILKQDHRLIFESIMSNISDYSFTEQSEESFIRFSFNKIRKEDFKMDVNIGSNYGSITNVESVESLTQIQNNSFEFEKIKTEFEKLQKKAVNAETKQQLNEGIKACGNKDRHKVIDVLKWLGKNAMDLIKTVSPALITALLTTNAS